jgi:hypothetical protein
VPRDIVILTSLAPDLAALVTAGADVAPELGVRAVEDGAVLQLCLDDGRAVLSLAGPKTVENPYEVARLTRGTVGPVSSPVFWTEAWVPWGPHADIGVEVALALASALGGTCVVEDGS